MHFFKMIFYLFLVKYLGILIIESKVLEYFLSACFHLSVYLAFF
jgi:hypothetical protein